METTHGPYDHIFLAAGCHATTEIVMRSTDPTATTRIGDSFSVNVPIIYTGGGSAQGDVFGLANALIMMNDATTGALTGQAQIYPTVNHFWRSASPSALWGPAAMTAIPMKRRLIWMRMYLPHEFANAYEMRLDSTGEARMELVAPKGAMKAAKVQLSALSDVLAGSGFHLIKAGVQAGGSSSHYASGLSDHEKWGLSASGHWGERVTICDSAPWRETPVLSLTFTIMANAMRLADQVFD